MQKLLSTVTLVTVWLADFMSYWRCVLLRLLAALTPWLLSTLRVRLLSLWHISSVQSGQKGKGDRLCQKLAAQREGTSRDQRAINGESSLFAATDAFTGVVLQVCSKSIC